MLVALAAAVLLAMSAAHHVAFAEPVMYGEGLALEVYASEFCCRLTGMEFMEDGSLLVLQKNGHVRLVNDGVLASDPVLVVDTISEMEMGLLGIARSGNVVYLYYTVLAADGRTTYNQIEQYVWDGQSLTDPAVIMELPANLYHNGGAMVTGPDGQVYAVIGDTGRYGPLQNKNLTEIHPPDTTDYMDTSVILKVAPSGSYHAVGIRNSFGLAFDPVTGHMWNTENGDDHNDEINLVPDGFNSGWDAIMGPATKDGLARMTGYPGYEYEDPKFTWHRTVAPTGIGFAEFGMGLYDNSVFVGDCNNGRLYVFHLNQDRDGLVFTSPDLQDMMADEGDNIQEIIAAEGLGCITGIRTGPDGYLYVASYSHDAIYRVLPASAVYAPPEGSSGCLIATAAYGTELAPQVQTLREIRDNKLLQTESGVAFMSAFNTLYYLFSPMVADYERESPELRAVVKGAITPMLYLMSLMDLANSNSEIHTILVGGAVIALNVVVYAALPVLGVVAGAALVRGRHHTGA